MYIILLINLPSLIVGEFKYRFFSAHFSLLVYPKVYEVLEIFTPFNLLPTPQIN